MHPVLHSFKRVYLRSTYFAAKWVKEYGLTPARFDMMTAIGRGPGIAQSMLRHVLHVSANVVSRMLRSLEALRLVERVPHPEDRRTLLVTLSYSGAEVLLELHQDWLEGCGAEHFTRHIISPHPHREDSSRHALRRTQRLLHTFRERLEDSSSLVYPCYTAWGERRRDCPLPRLPRWLRRKVRVVLVKDIPRLQARPAPWADSGERS